MSSNELIKIENVSQALVTTQESVELVFDEAEQGFAVAGVDDAISVMREHVNGLVSAGFSSDDDRKALLRVRAQMNKYTAAIKAEIKERQKMLFDQANDDLRRLNAAVQDMVADLNNVIEECDARYREQKQDEITHEFSKALVYRNFELDLITIFDSRWLNRTTTIGSIASDIDARLDMISSLTALGADVAEAIEYLTKNGWRLERALLQYNTDKQPVVENDIIEEDDEPVVTAVTLFEVSVPEGQEPLFRKRMDMAGWEYRQV